MSDDLKSLENDRTIVSGKGEGEEPTLATGARRNQGAKAEGGPGSSRSGRRSFQPDEMIAGRYRVIRFLARGGMGEVYEVEDSVLGGDVALKTILPEIAENPKALDRFRRETLLARKVTHPNVCRIFDIGRHEEEDVEAVFFLTMELLEGETLGERLRRGRLETVEALPLVEQMCAGLDAAHSVGIVHRDFKPANVFLVPGEDGPRAVITDFGLARPGGDSDAGVTQTGEVIGTPAYMAPEQLEGGALGPETDIYSLGLVMYEMLTGSRAFDGDTAFQVAVKRLQETPTSPSTHLPDLEPRWERCIMRCLERKPENRFRRVRDIPRVLRGEAKIPRQGRRHDFRPLLYVLIGILVILGGWAAWRFLPRASGGEQATSVSRGQSARKAAAVLGFRNVSGDPSAKWISTAISEVLTTELSGGKALRTIPGQTVNRCLRDLGMEEVQSLDPKTLEILHSNLGADLAVLGSYTVVPGGKDIRLDVRVQDVHSGEVIAAHSETGPQKDFLSLAEKVAAGLKTELDIQESSTETKTASLPTDPEAARLYSEGVEALRDYDYARARKKLEAAAGLSPDSAAVSLKLSELWRRLGFLKRSLDFARQALDASSELDQEQRLIAQARVAALSGRQEEAIRAWTSLWTFFPDNPDYGLALADAQSGAGRAGEALKTVGRLRALPEPTASDPRVDIAEARAAGVLGQLQRQLDAASRALARARELGARQLEAQSLGIEVDALIPLGRIAEAEKACRDAEKIWKELRDPSGVAGILHQRAVLAYRRGDLKQAGTLFEEMLSAYEKLGTQGGIAKACTGLGGVRLAEGDAEGARHYFEKSAAIWEKVGNPRMQASALGNLAVLAQRQGDFSSAIDNLERARVILSDAGARDGEAVVLRNIAATYYGRGDLEEARKAFEQAVALDRQTGHRAELAGSLFALGDVLTENAEWSEAARRFEESRKISSEIEDRAQEARAEFGSIVLRCEQYLLDPSSGDPPYKELGSIRKKLQDAGVKDAAILAGVLMVRLDEAGGNLDGAAKTLAELKSQLKDVPDVGTQVAVRVASSRLKALNGKTAEAVTELQGLQQQVEQSGILSLGYQVRLALGEAMLKSPGMKEQGRRVLEELKNETAPRGWRLLNRRIERLGKAGS